MNATNNNKNNSNLNLSQSSFVYMVAANEFTTLAPTSPAATTTTTNLTFTAAAEKMEQDIINHSLAALKVAASSIITDTNFTTNNINATTGNVTAEEGPHFYDFIVSWQGVILIAIFCILIVIVIIGNTLVILAIITTRRLKTITNCFVMSLAVADLLVGVFVMPPAVAVHLLGSWQLGWVLCDIWISLDVLLSTASILSLVAISIDRYLAVTQPLNYSRNRRSKRLALTMIFIVWLLALGITCPPMLGWYEPGRRDLRECRYNQNKGYVIYSAMGSFFLPMIVMLYVYARISCVIASRHSNMTDFSVHNNKKFRRYTTADLRSDPGFSVQKFNLGTETPTDSRRFSNQTIINELHEIMLPKDADEDDENRIMRDTRGRRNLLQFSSTANGRNSCYELTRPVSWKLAPTTTTTSETSSYITNGCNGDIGNNLNEQKRHKSCLRPFSSPPIDFRTAATAALSHVQHRASAPRINQHHHHFKSVSHCIMSLKNEHKTTQTLSIVVGGFIACWLPFSVYYLITPFLEEDQVSHMLAKAFTWLGWFNSAINPFIYAFYSVDFRAAFWRLTCRHLCSHTSRWQTQTPPSTMTMRL